MNTEQIQAIGIAAGKLDFEPIDLFTVFDFETAGTHDTRICNYTIGREHFSGLFGEIPEDAHVVAVGLIQWTAGTLKDMLRYHPGTPQTFAELAALTWQQQLDLAVAYLAHQLRHAKERDLSALYLAIFWPAAIPLDDDAILTSDPARAYRLNKGFDRDRDGIIRRREVVRAIHARKNSIIESGKWMLCWERNPPECVV